MADVFTRKKRSAIMAANKGHGTLSTEVAVRRLLRQHGIRGWRSHVATLPGRPDFAFRQAKAAVFVDGCFWHGCPLHYTAPFSRTKFWARKLQTNVERDFRVDTELCVAGWRPLRVWAHELADMEVIAVRIAGELATVGDNTTKDVWSDTVAEPQTSYRSKLWWACACGSDRCRVLSCSGPGGLKKTARRRPESVELLCWICGSKFSTHVE